jgi:histidinol-phosphate aminotransferase
VIVVLDEAYYEYLSPDLQSESMNWVKRFPNLIVTRTFSKIFGLAALRVGYGVASPEITELLNRVRQPFNVNSLAMRAAEVSLEDENFVSRSININRQGIIQLSRAFESRGLAFIRPHGNFITVEMPYDAGSIFQSLLNRGVIVRPISGYGLPNHLRVSVGLEQENNRFIEALDDSLSD